jgi:hypothetical protein
LIAALHPSLIISDLLSLLLKKVNPHFKMC